MSSDPPRTVAHKNWYAVADGDAEATRVEGKTRAPQTLPAAPPFPSIFEPEPPAPRYELRQLLGEGGYGRVYAAFDRDLEREVALKLVTPAPRLERELFVREARVTAGLVHPNIPALHDVAECNGTFYLSMERVTGQSLGSLIRAAADAGSTEVMPAIKLMEVMLKVADALEYAHAEGVVHRDVKPDNIMIGSYGEVKLVDWGAAHVARDESLAKGLVIGTPAYMAPEQLTSRLSTPSSDIYALGATLFHAVLLRAPLLRSESEHFMQRKERGSIDPPTNAELSRAPRALLGIAMKAMSAQVRDRYPSMKALSEALRDVLVGRKAWLAPLSETLEDDKYLERWVSIPAGAFAREGERLVSKAPDGCLLVYRQRLSAGVALEFEGEILAGERPGDLSVVWTEDDVFEPTHHWPTRSVSLQMGAFDNLAVGIYRDFWQCLQGYSLSVEVGRRYQIRAEIDEQAFRLLLDGKLIAEYELLFSTPSGYIAIYSYAPGKAFSNIRLFERAVPERISPTAVGDAFYAREEFATAANHYARIEQWLPSTETAEEARFKRGLCCLRARQFSLAEELWRELRADMWRVRATLHLVDREFQAGRHAHVVDELSRLLNHPRAPGRSSSILARALREEYRSDAASAASHYREYLALPNQERFSDSPVGDPLMDHWAAFRAERT